MLDQTILATHPEKLLQTERSPLAERLSRLEKGLPSSPLSVRHAAAAFCRLPVLPQLEPRPVLCPAVSSRNNRNAAIAGQLTGLADGHLTKSADTLTFGDLAILIASHYRYGLSLHGVPLGSLCAAFFAPFHAVAQAQLAKQRRQFGLLDRQVLQEIPAKLLTAPLCDLLALEQAAGIPHVTLTFQDNYRKTASEGVDLLPLWDLYQRIYEAAQTLVFPGSEFPDELLPLEDLPLRGLIPLIEFFIVPLAYTWAHLLMDEQGPGAFANYRLEN